MQSTQVPSGDDILVVEHCQKLDSCSVNIVDTVDIVEGNYFVEGSIDFVEGKQAVLKQARPLDCFPHCRSLSY